MNTSSKRPLSASLPGIAALLVALALLAYYFWPKAPVSDAASTAPAATGEQNTVISTPAPGYGPGVTNQGGILVDENGHRILNEAGLPISSEPLPVAKPIPIKAAPTEVIGYTVDAQGVSKPIRAGELKAVPNTPGSFAVVDMWAEGGPAVVPATKGQALSPAELERLRAAERENDRSGGQ